MIYPAQAQLEIYLSTSIYNNIKLKKYIKKINKQVVRQLHTIISSSWIKFWFKNAVNAGVLLAALRRLHLYEVGSKSFSKSAHKYKSLSQFKFKFSLFQGHLILKCSAAGAPVTSELLLEILCMSRLKIITGDKSCAPHRSAFKTQSSLTAHPTLS